jgi:hypothetical protein
MSLKAIVEITGSDPNGLRIECEQYCREFLVGEPDTVEQIELDDIADYLLEQYLDEIDRETTGADRLSVSVVHED